MDQQQQQFPPPASGRKRKNKNKSKPWQQGLQPRQKPLKYQTGGHNLGFFGTVPSLEDLRAANKQRTRQHFSGQRHKFRRPPRSTPKSIPRAPTHHAPSFPPGANPLDTPAPEIAAVPTAADKLEAEGLDSNLDFYGTNEGMLFRPRDDSASEQSELEGPSGDDEDYQRHPGSLAARLAEQEAYIATLEDENLRLRERLEMLQQEVADLRQGRDPEAMQEGGDSGSALSHGSHSSEDQSVVHHQGCQQQHDHYGALAAAAASELAEPAPS